MSYENEWRIDVENAPIGLQFLAAWPKCVTVRVEA